MIIIVHDMSITDTKKGGNFMTNATNGLDGAQTARRAYAMRRRGTLKEAVTELIGVVGGLERAAALVRVSVSTLQKYSSPNEEHADRHMPIDMTPRGQICTRSCRTPAKHAHTSPYGIS